MSPAGRRVGVLTVHGMGSGDLGAIDAFHAQVQARVASYGGTPDDVVLHVGAWYDLLEPRERALWDRLDRSGLPLDFRVIREWMVTHVGDALAYRQHPSAGHPVYRVIHERIAAHLADLEQRLGGGAAALLVAIGHSLGSVILSDHFWDAQKVPDPSRSPFSRGDTLAGFVTFGSPLPLFAFASEPIQPIRFPGRAVPETLRPLARWLNFYDQDDVLGYPLRATAYGYECTVDDDIPVDAGTPLVSWSPLSHTGYWSCGPVIDRTAELIARLQSSGA